MVRSLTVIIATVAFTLTPAVGGDYFIKHSSAPAATPTADTALVYWVFSSEYTMCKIWSFVDDKVVGIVKANGYVFANVAPGNHIFWSHVESMRCPAVGSLSKIELEVVAGKTYYLENDIRPRAMLAEVGLAPFDEEQGRQLLSQCQYFELTETGRERGAEIVATLADRIGEAAPIAASVVPENTAGMVLIPGGLEVEVELMENISSRHTNEGERILFRTTHDLEISDELSVPKGHLVRGVVRRVDRASGGGDAGEVDVLLPALVTRDGTKIPVVGRVIVEGRDRGGEASSAGTAGGVISGLVAFGLTKGDAAYVLAGERYSLTVREDTWINAGDDDEQSVRTREPVASAPDHEVLQGEDSEIIFKPHSRKRVKDVVVRVEMDQQLKEAALTSVGELTLLDPVDATKIRRCKHNRWEISIKGWNVLRYVRPEDRFRFDVPLRLTGVLDDGTRITATSVLTVVLLEDQT